MATVNNISQIDNYFRSILQATFHNLPDLVINVAREYNVSDSEALILIRDKLTQQINLVANQPKAVYDATNDKIKSLQSEIAFIKKLYVENNDKLMSRNNNLNRQYLACVGNKTAVEQSLERANQELAQMRQLGRNNNRNDDRDNAKILELQKRIDTLNSERDTLQSRMQTLINERNEVQSKLEISNLKGYELQNTLDEVRSRNESAANEYRQSLADMNDKYSQNLFELVKIINPTAKREDVEKMWSNLVAHLKSVTVLHETEQNLRAELETLKLANAGQENAAITQLQNDLMVKQQEVQQLQQDLSEARNSKEHLLASYAMESEDLKKQLQSTEENVRRLEDQKRELRSNYQILNAELSNLKQTNAYNANAADANANEISRLKDNLQKTFTAYKETAAKLEAAQEELQKERNTLKLFEKQLNQIPSTAIVSNLKHQAELFKRKEINKNAFVSDILQIINDPNYKRSIDYSGDDDDVDIDADDENDVNNQISMEQQQQESPSQITTAPSTSTEFHRRKRARRANKSSPASSNQSSNTTNTRERSRSPNRSKSCNNSSSSNSSSSNSSSSNSSSDSDDDSNSKTCKSRKREQTTDDNSKSKKRVCSQNNAADMQESNISNSTVSIPFNNDAILNATESQLEDSTNYSNNVTL